MDNQHKHIKGYRDLSATEIASMNEVKELAALVGNLIDKLATEDPQLLDSISVDKRWLAIAKTDLQKGFMSLVRSIAQPTSF